MRQIKLDNKRELSRLIQQRTRIESGSVPSRHPGKAVARIQRQPCKPRCTSSTSTIGFDRIRNWPSSAHFHLWRQSSPGYFMAKLIIKLINSCADVVNK